MDGTVNEGILRYKGQEKRKTLRYQQMRTFEECWEQGNMSIYVYGRTDKRNIDFCFGRIFDKYNVFLYIHTYMCSDIALWHYKALLSCPN